MKNEMQRYEYCAVSNLAVNYNGLAVTKSVIIQFTQEGAKSTPLPKDADGMAAAIALLGLEGWEMVGVIPYGNQWHGLYFKRPLP